MPKRLIDARPLTYGPLERSVNSLRGIRYLAPGENEGEGAGGDGGEGGSGGDGGDQGGSQGGGNGGGSNSNDGGTGNDGQGQRPAPTPRGRQQTFSPEYVTELRNENATRRKNETALTTRAETAESERDAERAELAQLKRERTIEKHAAPAGANPSALLDSAAFARETKDLDLTDEAAVKAAITAFVEKNPHVAANPSTGIGSSGGGRPGGQTSDRPDNSNSLSGAVGAALAGTGAHS